MKVNKVLVVMTVLSVLLACETKMTVVQKMLDKAKRGEDTGEYWVAGVAKQKLYNVTDYEIMSDGPLSETIKQYLPMAIEHFKQSIATSEKQIAEVNERTAKIRVDMPMLEQLTTASVPPLVPNDTHGNLTRLLVSMKSYGQSLQAFQQQYIGSDLTTALFNLDTAANWLGKANNYTDAFAKQTAKRAADIEIESAHSLFTGVVNKNRSLFDSSQQFLNAASGTIDSENASIAKNREEIAKLESLASKVNGVAYKVKINSTNKAGLPIVWIWTITVIESNKQWKVSYLYNEEDFGEEKDLRAMNVALLSILGK